jgi:hypothetical protein
MAKVNLEGINTRDITFTLDSQGLINKKNKKRVSEGTIGAISEFISNDYSQTVNTILGLYAGVGLKRNSYKTPRGAVSTNYPQFSESHSKYIESKGLNSSTKPFWGAITGDLSRYAKKVRVTNAAKVSKVSFTDQISTSKIKNFFSKLFTGEKSKVKILSMSANISLPELSSDILSTSISKYYLNELTESKVKIAIAQPRSEPKLGARPENAIAGEESFRPLIRPVAEKMGKEAFDDLKDSIDKTLSKNIRTSFFGKFR